MVALATALMAGGTYLTGCVDKGKEPTPLSNIKEYSVIPKPG
jgi:hypothetical protein